MTDKPTKPRIPFARVEDERLLRGLGRFAADAPAEGQACVHFLRSPHAFARVRRIETAAAARARGVLAVLTAADMEAAGIRNVSFHPPLSGRGGAKFIIPPRPPLARERVMHVGEPVAAIVAETAAAARDAAERIEVEYDPLPAVTEGRAALAAGAPQLWPDAPGNLAIDWSGPFPDDGANAQAVEAAMAGARWVARVSLDNQRIMVASMEPRGATATYGKDKDVYLLRVCSQGAGPLRDGMAQILGIGRERIRVITEDVGGAFGMKSPPYPEYAVLLVAARRVGRPVHWMSAREEAFLSDNQARDIFADAELALDEKGKFLALRIRSLAALGAYNGSLGAFVPTGNFTRCFPGMYRIPLVAVDVRCVFTNTVPTGPYRGAGRPEANYLLERVVDEAARVSGIDRITLRRRNFIPSSAMPYKTPVGTTYDSGAFREVLEKALALAEYDTFARRRREAARRGKRRGIGISCFLEHAGGGPTEGASLSFPGDRTLIVGLGVHSTGQSHATVFARLAAERLAIPASAVRVSQGDSRLEIDGFASVASRSAMAVGHALVDAADKVIAKGRAVAAALMEAAEADIAYGDGIFEVAGTDRRIGLFELAAKAKELAAAGDLPEALDTKTAVNTPPTFPNGCHIAEVEVDPDTGAVTVVGYTAVDDCGAVLDHTVVEGQVHGALAQGLGQALRERAVYDDSGQLVTGSFMDYAMPRADDMPPIRDALHPVAATTNPLGVKGVGEAGTTAAPAAIMNAIADAVPGAAALDMPATTEKVWRACRASR